MLSLRIATPMTVAVDATQVRSVRAEDASGAFGVWPGHADFLTVLGASVLRWRGQGEKVWHYCALRGGVLRVVDGARVEVACREAVVGDDLAALQAVVSEDAARRADEARRARGEQMRLHTRAIRSLMQHLGQNGADPLAEEFR
ncbi:F0F1 ATP synthase subunit epsilon [Sinirhodobacter sp. WL0062]|uniref:F0F1 ATP synthase subunit epsilon n=1 Tax=Rhodobacter flavimaris TaxID=2907145 RepID=A0ABS8YRJ2_9RHOB|nr:F0F1 ATP synthase subunit epsilon [Sinirhodobacter sp. WL0062]MCE5972053.1 F0F1 ATP synthase subunit epsilon [Sinirhodobacter sp. WL0062]